MSCENEIAEGEECPHKAEWSVGVGKRNIHLCSACASSEKFKLRRIRKPLKQNMDYEQLLRMAESGQLPDEQAKLGEDMTNAEEKKRSIDTLVGRLMKQTDEQAKLGGGPIAMERAIAEAFRKQAADNDGVKTIFSIESNGGFLVQDVKYIIGMSFVPNRDDPQVGRIDISISGKPSYAVYASFAVFIDMQRKWIAGASGYWGPADGL